MSGIDFKDIQRVTLEETDGTMKVTQEQASSGGAYVGEKPTTILDTIAPPSMRPGKGDGHDVFELAEIRSKEVPPPPFGVEKSGDDNNRKTLPPTSLKDFIAIAKFHSDSIRKLGPDVPAITPPDNADLPKPINLLPDKEREGLFPPPQIDGLQGKQAKITKPLQPAPSSRASRFFRKIAVPALAVFAGLAGIISFARSGSQSSNTAESSNSAPSASASAASAPTASASATPNASSEKHEAAAASPTPYSFNSHAAPFQTFVNNYFRNRGMVSIANGLNNLAKKIVVNTQNNDDLYETFVKTGAKDSDSANKYYLGGRLKALELAQKSVKQGAVKDVAEYFQKNAPEDFLFYQAVTESGTVSLKAEKHSYTAPDDVVQSIVGSNGAYAGSSYLQPLLLETFEALQSELFNNEGEYIAAFFAKLEELTKQKLAREKSAAPGKTKPNGTLNIVGSLSAGYKGTPLNKLFNALGPVKKPAEPQPSAPAAPVTPATPASPAAPGGGSGVGKPQQSPHTYYFVPQNDTAPSLEPGKFAGIPPSIHASTLAPTSVTSRTASLKTDTPKADTPAAGQPKPNEPDEEVTDDDIMEITENATGKVIYSATTSFTAADRGAGNSGQEEQPIELTDADILVSTNNETGEVTYPALQAADDEIPVKWEV